MPAYADAFPWNKVSEKTRTGRQRMSMTAGNYEWDLTEGWHLKRGRGWKGKGKRSGNVEKVQRTTPDGKTITVYKTKGYDDTIGFHSHDNPSDEIMAFVTSAFDKENKSLGPIFEQDGCGHISKLEYAQNDLVLKVTFATDGAVCAFLGVPTAVAGQLLSLAQTKRTQCSAVDGKERHVLGMVFWDLVRIRGQRHGSRYPFEYVEHGRYKLTGSSRRYSVVLSDENYKKILGTKYAGPPLKPGEKVTAILSEEEYAAYQEEEHMRAMLGEQRKTISENESIEVTGVTDEYYSGAEKQANGKGLSEILGDDLPRYLELMQQMTFAQSEAQANREAELAGQTIEMSEAAKKELWSKYMSDPRYQKNGIPDFEKIADEVMKASDVMVSGNEDYADRRYKGYHVKLSESPERVTVTPHQVFNNKKDLNDYLRLTALIRKADNPTRYAARFVGAPWTIQRLKDFANPTVKGAISIEHAPLYKRLLQANDYEAALNFLKNHKHNVEYENSRTGHKTTIRRPYATQYDYLSMED